MAKEKVILAYSGGLDTTAIIPWLKENYDYDVVCCCVDCGQGNELDGLEERAKYSGAAKLYIEDITDEFCDDYIIPCVQAGAVYENKYLLGTSMARPGIAKKLVEIARKEGAVAICHGATGKGNDQIRFELSIKALAPDIKIIAPWRDSKWKLQSREDEIEYCKQHGIDLPFGTDQSYSRDRNLWHISHEGLELEDPANEPNYDHLLVLGVSPEKAPDEPEYVTMTFEKGVPTSVNGKKMKVSDIIRELNRLGMETQFINGLRVTDEDTLEAAEMVLNSVNKKLVQIVEQLGVRAIGISGKDGRLLTVKKKLSEGQDIGYVGEVTHVNEDILLELLEDDFLPIVCPIGLDEDYHGYNINADDAASAIAEAVKAEKLAFLTDTEGVYMDKDDSSTVISEMTVSEAEKLIEDGIIAGGMLPKIKNCMDAIKNGVSRVHILDGRIPHSILLEIFTNKGVGTAILDDEQEKFYTDLLNK